MMSHWYPKTALGKGRVVEVEHVRDWRPHDRHQVARVVLDDGEEFTFLGREPEEFFFRRPRKRLVDRDEVAGLKVGDYVSFEYIVDSSMYGCVTSLTVNPKWAPSAEHAGSGATVTSA